MLIRDPTMVDRLIEERMRKGLDHHDEVWEGMSVTPSMPNNDHQRLVGALDNVFRKVTNEVGVGESYPGANVSDRRKGWDHNFRVPDLVVVLHNSRAIDCGTHFCGGPDFLVEIQSPGDDAEEKVPFYGKIGVRELLILHRDRRTMQLLRLAGEELVPVQPTLLEGKEWLVSEVIPLTFRRTSSKGGPRTSIRRTDGTPGRWTL
jgi:Uma2 family endonuclease